MSERSESARWMTDLLALARDGTEQNLCTLAWPVPRVAMVMAQPPATDVHVVISMKGEGLKLHDTIII